jgi:hypothetical protein
MEAIAPSPLVAEFYHEAVRRKLRSSQGNGFNGKENFWKILSSE